MSPSLMCIVHNTWRVHVGAVSVAAGGERRYEEKRIFTLTHRENEQIYWETYRNVREFFLSFCSV